MLPDCKKPRDEGQIAQNRKSYLDKSGAPKGRKKWGDNRKGGGKPYAKKHQAPHGGSGVALVGNE